MNINEEWLDKYQKNLKKLNQSIVDQLFENKQLSKVNFVFIK